MQVMTFQNGTLESIRDSNMKLGVDNRKLEDVMETHGIGEENETGGHLMGPCKESWHKRDYLPL